jgi:hypothetical protein
MSIKKSEKIDWKEAEAILTRLYRLSDFLGRARLPFWNLIILKFASVF